MSATKKTKTASEESVEIVRLHRETATIYMLGVTPLIIRRLSEKARAELLFPTPFKKSAGTRATTLKHDPYEEFRDSPYIDEEETSPTLLMMPSECFKNALCGVAVDVPGSVTKAVLKRNTYVHGDYVPIWGVPCLKMDVVRSANMQRTPDVRTRLAVKRWAAIVRIEFARPILNEDSLRNLAANAGFQGVGDWRQQKGAGNFGQWEIVNDDNKEFRELVKNAGRATQKAAMDSPAMYDRETRELLTWFEEAAVKAGHKITPVASQALAVTKKVKGA